MLRYPDTPNGVVFRGNYSPQGLREGYSKAIRVKEHDMSDERGYRFMSDERGYRFGRVENERSASPDTVDSPKPLIRQDCSEMVVLPPATQVSRGTVTVIHAPDPAPLERLWEQLIVEYFPNHAELRWYRVSWSSRQQKRVLASCDVIGRRVRVARELARPEYESFLSPLLYHEMCHAAIGRDVERRSGVRLWHGPQFRVLEARHPGSVLLQEWITSGGWATAVRRDRAFAAAHKRKQRQYAR